MPAALFSPSPSSRAQLLDDFSNPMLSLQAIAAAHKTTLAALSAFISRPDIQALLEVRKDVASQRVQLIAVDHLPPAIAAASSVLAAFHSEEAALKPDPTTLAKRTDPALDYRARRTALYSASLLFRLSRPVAFRPAPRSAHPRDRLGEANNSPPPGPSPSHAPRPFDLAALEQLVSQLEALDPPADAEPHIGPHADIKVNTEAAARLPEPDSASQFSDLRFEIPTRAPAAPAPSPTNRTQVRRPSNITTLAGLAPGP